MTAHRRENIGEPLENICHAMLEVVDKDEDLELVYLVHFNPLVQKTANEILGGHKRIHLLDPISLSDMHNLIAKSYILATDSGGLQEEAPALNKPVVVLRNTTERPEGVEAGTLKLAGNKKEEIVDVLNTVMYNTEVYNSMANAANPYGDGYASKKIVDAILEYFKGQFMSDNLENKEQEDKEISKSEINYKEEAEYLQETINKLKSGEDNTVKEFLKLDNKEKAKIASAYALLSQIAIQVIVIMASMFFLGLWLDKKFGTAPWFMLGLMLLGMASAFKSIYDIGMNQVKKFDRPEKTYKSYRKHNMNELENDDDDESSNSQSMTQLLGTIKEEI